MHQEQWTAEEGMFEFQLWFYFRIWGFFLLSSSVLYRIRYFRGTRAFCEPFGCLLPFWLSCTVLSYAVLACFVLPIPRARNSTVVVPVHANFHSNLILPVMNWQRELKLKQISITHFFTWFGFVWRFQHLLGQGCDGRSWLRIVTLYGTSWHVTAAV